MVIAFLTMEGVEAEAEMEASLEVIDVLENLDENMSQSHMFFWTDDESQKDIYRKEMGITWDTIPSMGAKCGATNYVYPKENPFTP